MEFGGNSVPLRDDNLLAAAPSDDHHYPRVLVVGGTGRNVGKTELVCRLITHCIRQHQPLWALKVSAVFPGEAPFHGNHDDLERRPPFLLFEEQDRDSAKDTSRMLRAGAQRAFFLSCENEQVLPAFLHFSQTVPPRTALICESNSLADYLRPGLHVMVTSRAGVSKPRSRRHLETADLVIVSDGINGFPETAALLLDHTGCWHLAPQEMLRIRNTTAVPFR